MFLDFWISIPRFEIYKSTMPQKLDFVLKRWHKIVVQPEAEKLEFSHFYRFNFSLTKCHIYTKHVCIESNKSNNNKSVSLICLWSVNIKYLLHIRFRHVFAQKLANLFLWVSAVKMLYNIKLNNQEITLNSHFKCKSFNISTA